jgi:hypothetical protein
MNINENTKLLRNRYRGALLGLAAGDALGATLEFKPPGTFRPLTDMRGGGPFNLQAGQWTDDTVGASEDKEGVPQGRTRGRFAPRPDPAGPRRLPSTKTFEVALMVSTALTRAPIVVPESVHGDIKPDNVLFLGGIPHVGDFGIAKAVDWARHGGGW